MKAVTRLRERYKKARPYLKYMWLSFFVLNVILVGILSAIGLYFYFTLPSTPITITEPANAWMLVLFGGVISREFMLGLSTGFFWFAYRDAASKSTSSDFYNQKGEEKKQ